MIQKGNFLIQGHLAVKVCDTLFSIKPPVLIWVKFAIVVEVFEFKAVNFNDVFQCCSDFRLSFITRNNGDLLHLTDRSVSCGSICRKGRAADRDNGESQCQHAN